MAKDMEGLQKAEQSLQEMQKVWFVNFCCFHSYFLKSICLRFRSWNVLEWNKKMLQHRKWI